jgi:hypothetical protein
MREAATDKASNAVVPLLFALLFLCIAVVRSPSSAGAMGGQGRARSDKLHCVVDLTSRTPPEAAQEGARA